MYKCAYNLVDLEKMRSENLDISRFDGRRYSRDLAMRRLSAYAYRNPPRVISSALARNGTPKPALQPTVQPPLQPPLL